jgi:hypothetical protein
MGLRGRTVYEYVHEETLIEWVILPDGGARPMIAVAALSPLTSDWLVGTVEPAGESITVPRLEDARRYVLGGNGRRYGGHTEVTLALRGTSEEGRRLIKGTAQ